jgi:hypothetical protein
MMRTVNWRHTDWGARNFVFSVGETIIGHLSFYSSWNFNAVFTDQNVRIKFSQKNFWNRDVMISQAEQKIGEVTFSLFGNQLLTLETGERFTLSTNVWGRNVTWKNQHGEVIVQYRQATMSSMGKGVINLVDSLPGETEKLLMSCGLFVRQLILKRVALVVAMFIPIIAASNR